MSANIGVRLTAPGDLRLIVDHVVDYAIFMLDTEGRVATWSLGAQRIKGYTADEIGGKHVSIFYTPEDIAGGRPERQLATAIEQGRVEDEGWRVRKDGTRFWANVVVTAMRDENAQLVGFAKVTRDLTQRRLAEQAERELRRSEEVHRDLSRRLEIILEGVADGITVQDRSGRLIFANAAAARSCGFETGQELVSAPIEQLLSRFEMFGEDGRPFPADELPGRRVLRGENSEPTLLRVRLKGTRRDQWSLIRATAVNGPDGAPEIAVNIWHDVTGERREEHNSIHLADAAAALASSLDEGQMLRALAQCLVPKLADWCSIVVRDGDSIRNAAVTHADPAKRDAAAEYMKRYPPTADSARGVGRVLATGTPELYNDITDEILVRQARDDEHLRLLREAGMRSVLIAPMAVYGRIVGAISLIVAETDRYYEQGDIELLLEIGRRAAVAVENAQLLRASQQAARAAEEASRAKDEFLATVSHELRTPLNAIVGWAALIKDRMADPALAKAIEVIHRNAEAQVKIIDDILDVSRVITGKFRLDPRPIDLVAIARETIEVVRPSAFAKSIEVTLEAAPDCCLFVGDPVRMQQVVWNLLSNAVKFTETGGKVRIYVGQEGSEVLLSVTDTGMGIDHAFLPYVFDRFKQADGSIARRVGGLGLGLALVRHIVELHGGDVVARSEGAGKGASFTIRLPARAIIPATAADRPSPAPAEVRIPAGQPRFNGMRILVVDDEADARDLIATILSKAGALVETAASAAEGFDALKRIRPDVLVSDIGMPGEDGFSFIRRIRELGTGEGGKTPAVALTAYAREEDRNRALASGFTLHLGKPITPEVLTSAVAKVVSAAR